MYKFEKVCYFNLKSWFTAELKVKTAGSHNVMQEEKLFSNISNKKKLKVHIFFNSI